MEQQSNDKKVEPLKLLLRNANNCGLGEDIVSVNKTCSLMKSIDTILHNVPDKRVPALKLPLKRAHSTSDDSTEPKVSPLKLSLRKAKKLKKTGNFFMYKLNESTAFFK